jgi:hypothetical protein
VSEGRRYECFAVLVLQHCKHRRAAEVWHLKSEPPVARSSAPYRLQATASGWIARTATPLASTALGPMQRSRFGMSPPDLSNELKRAQNYRLPISSIQNISGLPQGLADLIAAVCTSSIGGRQGCSASRGYGPCELIHAPCHR